MINGIDMLLVAIALVLILIVWEVWDRYTDWSEWDRDRRRERRLARIELQDKIAEKKYRYHIRLDFRTRLFAEQMRKTKMTFDNVTASVKRLNELMDRAKLN